MAEETVYPQLNDRATTRNKIFQQKDASIKITRKNRIFNNKLTAAEKRRSRIYRKRA